MNSPSDRIQVLIAGAGPTGLTLACDLARRGVRARIVEKSPHRLGGSRGRGLQPRTQEVFDDLGILDEVHAADGIYPTIRSYRNGELVYEGRLAEFVEPTPGEPYPNAWMCPQWRTEEILRTRLAELGGGAVEFGTELVAFEQDDDGVTVTLIHGGDTEQVRADYLVGADGGHSVVRRILNIPFEGETDETVRMLVADVGATGIDREYWRSFVDSEDPKLLISLCPMAGTDSFQLIMPVEPDTPASPTVEYLQAVLDRRSGGSDIRLHDLTWATIWRSNVRMVRNMREGRVFLAGDAAHVHPPTGGQGLNTGVQDAYNLGWKLGAVLAGGQRELLDTYEAERLPVVASVLGLSTTLLNKTIGGDPEGMRRGRETRQLDLSYWDGPLARDERANPGAVQSGDRAPDAPCQDAQGRAVRLFDAFRGPHFTLLAFGTEHAGTVEEVNTRCAPLVHAYNVLRPGDTAGPHALVDVDGHIASGYGIEAPVLVLVRPDGYLGLVSAPGTAAAVAEYVRRPVQSSVTVD